MFSLSQVFEPSVRDVPGVTYWERGEISDKKIEQGDFVSQLVAQKTTAKGKKLMATTTSTEEAEEKRRQMDAEALKRRLASAVEQEMHTEVKSLMQFLAPLVEIALKRIRTGVPDTGPLKLFSNLCRRVFSFGPKHDPVTAEFLGFFEKQCRHLNAA